MHSEVPDPPFSLTRRRLMGGAVAASAAGMLVVPGSAATAQEAGRPKAGKPLDVIVIGAGLSGLNAALMLEAEGLTVAVLEGRRRVGGRVFTLDDVPGHPEGGGNGIGAGYARILDMANRLKVPLIPVRQRTETTQGQSIINLGNETLLPKDWAASPLNPFPQALKSKLPWEVQWGFYMKNNPLKDAGDWLDPRFAQFDISLYDFMKSQGLDDPTISLACGTGMLYGTNAFDFSLLAMYHTLAWGAAQRSFGTEAYAVDQGNQRLPEAMAKALKTEVQFGRAVTGISDLGDRVRVTCADGSQHEAKRLVVTTPFTALRSVRFDPVLPAIKAEAVAQLGYTTAFQAHFVPTSPFWEEDGLPPNLWTDGPAGRFAALQYGDKAGVTSFLAFVNGAQGERLDRMAPDDATAAILAHIARIRPASAGKLKPVKVLSWQRDPFAGALYSSWKPGQITRYASTFSKPHGRIHFAGEHTAELNRGMEGAMESGERAAIEVLSTI